LLLRDGKGCMGESRGEDAGGWEEHCGVVGEGGDCCDYCESGSAFGKLVR
jgi:hypothetical protein